jgi:hypothetical protein
MRTKNRRYPIEPVRERMASWRRAANAFPPSIQRAFYRAPKEGGLTEEMADRVATELGLHPSDLWPDWGRDELLREVS